MKKETDDLYEYGENLFEAFFEVIPDIFFLMDEEGVIKDYRAKKDRFLYVPPEQLLEKKMVDIIPIEVGNLFRKSLESAIERQEMVLFEYDLSMENGMNHYECRLNFLPKSRQCIAIVRDITKQYLAMQALSASEERFRTLLENAPFPIFIIRISDYTVRYGNQRAKTRFGTSNDMGIGSPSKEYYVYPEDRERFLEQLQRDGEVVDFEAYMTTIDKKPYWALMSAAIVDIGNEPSIMVSVNDISHRKKIEDNLKTSEEKYRLLTEYTSDVIWVLNLTKEEYTYISPSVQALRGFTAEEAMKQKLEESVSKESAVALKELILRGMDEFVRNPETPSSYISQVQQPCKNGEFVWVEISIKYRFNSKNEIELVGVSRNIEMRKMAEEEVLYLSFHDQLTGLYNRRFYEEELKRLDSERNLPITLVMADVNGLKMTNDAFGHLAGDQILKSFADILKKESRTNDIVARIGGDEFVMLLINTDAAQAELQVERIKAAIISERKEDINLSVSFGWQTKQNMYDSMEEIFKQAEDFMYRKKLLEGKSYKSDTIRLITSSLYKKDEIERLHSERVCELCKAIGTVLGFSAPDIDEIGLAGLLHDIGKIGINEKLLKYKNDLNGAQWSDIKRHPEIGYQILRSVSEFANIAEIVLAHHEREDGKGYPRGLLASEIKTGSKILAVAEAYDYMTREYPYKAAITSTEAIKELKKGSGKQFDGDIVKIFIGKVLKNN